MEPDASIEVVAMELHPRIVARTLANVDKPDALIVLNEASVLTDNRLVDILPDTVIPEFPKESTPEIFTVLLNDVAAVEDTIPATRK
jgi:hypothetical protein